MHRKFDTSKFVQSIKYSGDQQVHIKSDEVASNQHLHTLRAQLDKMRKEARFEQTSTSHSVSHMP